MNLTPQDDPTIKATAVLWRRIPPWHSVEDHNLQRKRPSSAAFENDPDGQPMSVVLGDEVLAAGRNPASVLAGHEGLALAAIPAALVRSCGQVVVRNPVPGEPCHALVWGDKTKSVQRRLAKAASWVIPPPSPEAR